MRSAAFTLVDFVRESNRIEGILRDPTGAEIEAHEEILAASALTIEGTSSFVRICAGERHRLRDRRGLNVRVGDHIAPSGGPGIALALRELLDDINARRISAYAAHIAYETLHPFTDGNGRSGRVIWLWQMGGEAPLGFLHSWYYQSLANSPARVGGKQ